MPTFSPPGGTLALPGNIQLVVRYHAEASGSERFELLPNVVPLNVQWAEGLVPPTAQFTYILDSTNPGGSPFPFLIEQLWPLNAPSTGFRVENDDRLLVYDFDPFGNRFLCFDGFATIPQVNQAERLSATF